MLGFTFLGSLLVICTNPQLGYEGMIGAVILGGIFEGLVGLSAKYWKRFLTPVVSACVVIAIGLSLLSVGMDSWGGGTNAQDFGAWYHLFVGAFTLIVCLVSRYLLKGVYKNLNILVGLVFGYLLSIVFTVADIAPMVDFSGISKTIQEVGYFSIPKLVFFTSHQPVFDLGAFFTIAIVFLVSAAETTGATTAVCKGALDRDIKMEELQGSLAVDGFSSAISGCFGCLPLTSFSQNVGLVTMTRVINRFTIFVGAVILILASLFPPLGAFFNSLPQAVLGGCTVMMFGSIMYEGIKMLKDNEFDDRTMIIVSLSFCIGVGLTQTSGNFFAAFPSVVGDIFNGNAVAGVFVVSLLLSLFLPKEKKEKQENKKLKMI
ncbi:solute carrier family 23 protein [Coprobacillaceae bacterium CR2/5/TPMF4]|nr:solute carrier family 23 protein [Coprobacillaceae bacterium CR2/5/TPMF4]